MAQTASLNGAYGSLPRTTLSGAFPARSGVPVRFSAGRSRARPPQAATWDEVDVRKWPVAARLALMILSSLLLWIGIAALVGLLR